MGRRSARVAKYLRRFLVVGALSVGVLVGGTQYKLVDEAAPYVVDEDSAPKVLVAIVLGAGIRNDGTPGAVLADRLESARRLYDNGRVAKILVSGDNDGVGVDEVNPMREWLVSRGVPSEDVYMDHAGFRTNDTMQRARWVFGVESAIICTQEFHVHRAVYLARNAGIAAVGVASREDRWRAHFKANSREVLARTRAVIDVAVRTQPRYLGERIPIAKAPAEKTHDSRTRI